MIPLMEHWQEWYSLTNAAAAGPWRTDYDRLANGADRIVTEKGVTVCLMPGTPDQHVANSDFIAMSRQAIPALLAEVVTLNARLEALRQVGQALLAYRDQNPLNFQLEKADDYFRDLRALFADTAGASDT